MVTNVMSKWTEIHYHFNALKNHTYYDFEIYVIPIGLLSLTSNMSSFLVGVDIMYLDQMLPCRSGRGTADF
jgi:hypothetical protein